MVPVQLGIDKNTAQYAITDSEVVTIFYLVGFATKIKKDIWAGKYQCQSCGRTSNFHLYKVKNYGYIFYAPIIAKTVKRLFVCDSCQAYKELPKKECEVIEKLQKAKLKHGDIPTDVIAQDFNPGEIKYGRKILLLVLAVICGVIMTASAIGRATDIAVWDASVPIGILYILALGLLPLLFAIKSVLNAAHKRKIYFSVSK